jgi:AcrR family transcriptional regulator
MAGDTPATLNWPYTAILGRIETKIDALAREMTALENKLGMMMATLQEALDGWRAYVEDLKAQLAAAVQGLTDAQAAAQAAADALAAFQADDAVTDAAQLAAQAQADADAVQAALDAVKTPVPPPVIEEPVEP